MKQTTFLERKAKQDEEHLRNSRYGPPATNPFKVLRTMAKLSREELASRVHVDYMVIKRSEEGLYTNPSPILMDYWVSYGEDYLQIQDQYYQFIDKQRERHHLYFGPNLHVESVKSGATHPFRYLRQNRPSIVTEQPLPVGITETSKALCVPLDSLQHFEKKWRRCASVPKALKAALLDVGYSELEIAKFENQYLEWRSNQPSTFKLSESG